VTPGPPLEGAALAGSAAHHLFPRNPNGLYTLLERGAGAYLFDSAGRRLLDGASGAAVACLGHAHPRIVAALARQASTLAFAHASAFVTRPVLELAERLADLTRVPGCRVYFASGGSEAIETAIKLARTYQLACGHPDRHRIVSRSVSYHGATLGALSASGLRHRRAPYEPFFEPLRQATTCYCYRCPVGLRPDSCRTECADDVEAVVVGMGPETVAGLLIEPVIGASAPGVVAPAAYMSRVAETCRRHDMLLIADEVMSGVGRTGRFLAMEHYGVEADITVLSKALSGGYAPLAAVVVTPHVFDAVRGAGEFVHGFTYSGHPLSAAVGLEVLDVIEEEGLVDRVRVLGERLLTRLRSLESLAIVGEVRGRGLLAGVEIVADRATRAPFPRTDRIAAKVFDASLARGVIVYPTTGAADGWQGDHVLVAPPYIVTEEQVDRLVAALGDALRQVQTDVLGAS
jgi:adenosylmethionine-8-amino-7-oxononanoate aminotransferase